MVHNKIRVILTLLVLIISPIALTKDNPIYLETSFLQSACSLKATRYAKGFCEGAIEAYIGLMPNWCVTDDITHDNIKRFFMTKIQQTPKSPSIRLPAQEFVWKIISMKYPCE